MPSRNLEQKRGSGDDFFWIGADFRKKPQALRDRVRFARLPCIVPERRGVRALDGRRRLSDPLRSARHSKSERGAESSAAQATDEVISSPKRVRSPVRGE